MTPEQIDNCKTILDTLTANPMTGVTAELAVDGAVTVTYDGVSFTLRDNEWCGNGVTMIAYLNSASVMCASAVREEVCRVGSVMMAACGRPDPAIAAERTKIAAALGHTGTMTALDLVALARRVHTEAVGARKEAVEAIARLRETDPLGMLGAPAAYDNGQALTVKERLSYLLARIP